MVPGLALSTAGRLAWLPGALGSRPTTALLLASLGAVLLLGEFHRPGWVLPGAAGTGLMLLGGYGLAMQPLRWWAVWMLVAAAGLLLVPWRLPGWAMLSVPGVLTLCVGLAFLVRGPSAGWVPVAVLDGLVLGSASGLLATVAGRARRAKVSGRPGRSFQRGKRDGGGRSAGERWE